MVKFVKALYWIETGGEVLENYQPGWWIFPNIDTSREDYIEKLLKGTKATVQWDDRFIARHLTGHPSDGVGGFVSCSLHFYTDRCVGQGVSWQIIAQPMVTIHEGKSLYDHFESIFGEPSIPSQSRGS